MKTGGKRLGFVALFLMWLFIAGIPVGLGWYEFAGPGYYAELNAVKRELARIPDVRVVDAGGNKDITLEHLYGEVDVAGKGRINFSNLTLDSFINGKPLHISSIGPYQFKREGEEDDGLVKSKTGRPVRSQFISFVIDIGPGGDCAALFPFALKNVRDVIEHYDAICAELAKWPVAPATKHHRTPDGEEFDYCIEKR